MKRKSGSRILAGVRKICLTFPETSERLSHGAPAFFIGGTRSFVTYMDNHHGGGRLALWCASTREHYFIPPYVGHLGWIGVRLDRGLMRPAGLKAFELRKKSGTYSYEQRNTAKLDDSHERQFRRNKGAWNFFQSQPPWYHRTAIWWVVSAKREETRQKRLAVLIRDSGRGRTIAPRTRRTQAVAGT